MEDAVRAALATLLPKIVSDIKEAISKDMDVRFEMLGLSNSTPEDRAEVRKDLDFVRSSRRIFWRSASTVGGVVISLCLFGAIALAGYGFWFKNAVAGKN
ncbi:MAG: hypothetical protein KGL39_35025 [Patescibacteria group bacterium]|nr:hypothetical protein [Patescibacteria group bacterium]